MQYLLGIIASFFLLLPLYLWAYGSTRIDDRASFLRWRFWIGGILGALSVLLVYLVSQTPEHMTFLESIGVFAGFFLVIVLIVYGLTFLGSVYARVFLQKITLIHAIIISLLWIVMLSVSYLIAGSTLPVMMTVPILIAAYFEEASKHLSTVGMLSKDFHFTRRDLAFFALSIVLGFVFFENILYVFALGGDILLIWYRSLFTLSAHLLSTLVCTWIWWKALSYPFFSLRYIGWFLVGFFGATLLHALYNLSVQGGSILTMILFLVGAYGIFVMMIREG